MLLDYRYWYSKGLVKETVLFNYYDSFSVKCIFMRCGLAVVINEPIYLLEKPYTVSMYNDYILLLYQRLSFV